MIFSELAGGKSSVPAATSPGVQIIRKLEGEELLQGVCFSFLGLAGVNISLPGVTFTGGDEIQQAGKGGAAAGVRHCCICSQDCLQPSLV